MNPLIDIKGYDNGAGGDAVPEQVSNTYPIPSLETAHLKDHLSPCDPLWQQWSSQQMLLMGPTAEL